MLDAIDKLLNAPTGSLLVIAGIAFLLIAVGVKLSGKIEPGPRGQVASGIIGVCLLVVGLTVFANPSRSPDTPAANASSAERRRPDGAAPSGACGSLVPALFSERRDDRRHAQATLIQLCASDAGTVDQVIDQARRNRQSREGVYDALSFLDSVPQSAVSDPALRRKIHDFALEAATNSADSVAISNRLAQRY